MYIYIYIFVQKYIVILYLKNVVYINKIYKTVTNRNNFSDSPELSRTLRRRDFVFVTITGLSHTDRSHCPVVTSCWSASSSLSATTEHSMDASRGREWFAVTSGDSSTIVAETTSRSCFLGISVELRFRCWENMS